MQQIIVTGLEGGRHVLHMATTCTIEQLFADVLRTCAPGVSTEELRLVYGGSELERGKGHTIATYDIPNMGQIFMVIRLKGGRGGGGGGVLVGAGVWLPLPLRIKSLVCGDAVTTTYEPDMITFDSDYSSGARLKMPCGHAIGAGTLLDYCTSIVNAGQLLFRCPFCSGDWSYAFIRKALQFQGQSVVTLDCKVSENSFRVIPGFQKCPRGLCAGGSVWLFRDPTELFASHSVRCALCDHVFCWSCLRQWTSSGAHCGYSDCPNGVDPRIRFLQTQPLKTIGLVSGCPSVRGCQRCGTLLQHTDACKHMTCKSCKLQFCFVCLKPFNVSTKQWQCGAHSAVCAVAAHQTTLPQPN